MVDPYAGAVCPFRTPVEIPAQRVRHGLGLVVVVETSHVAPAGVAAELDESGSEHDAKTQPAQKQDSDKLRSGTAAAEKNGVESGFEQDGFPTKTVEGLSDVDK